MARLRQGYTGKNEEGKWFARYDYVDPTTGKDRTVRRFVKPNTATRANEVLQELLASHTKRIRAVPVEIKNFEQLLVWYRDRYVKAPEYVNGRKVAGLRSWKSVQSRLLHIADFFQKKPLHLLCYRDLEDYKIKRLQTKITAKSTEEKAVYPNITTINRELEILRTMITIAVREGWMADNPFLRGDALMSKADETKRQHIISPAEEALLLSLCTGYREHLRDIIIFQLDIGCRAGETFKLQWEDVCLRDRTVTIQKMSSKTGKERKVGITERVYQLLVQRQQATGLVFGIKDNVRKSFRAVCKAAGLRHIRFHDLRHTFCTRLIQVGIPAEEAAKLSGHDQMSTFYRYVNVNDDTLKRAASALDNLHQTKVA
jgi:integrase